MTPPIPKQAQHVYKTKKDEDKTQVLDRKDI